MPGDILQDLLGEALKAPSPGYSGGIFAPPSAEDQATQRKPAIDAIVHSLATGREPVAVPKPNMGGLLGRLGVTSQYTDVSPELRDQMTLAHRIADQQGRQATLDKLDSVLRATTVGGSTYGKSIAGDLGSPELGEGLPTGVEGKGQLAQSAQYNKLQQMLFSQNAKDRELADREWHNQMSNAIQENRLDDANQLMDIRGRQQDLRDQEYQTNPLYRTLQGEQGRLESRVNELMAKRGDVLDPNQQKYIDQQIQAAEDRIQEIDSGMADAGNDPEKLRGLLRKKPGSPVTGGGGSGTAIKPGLFSP